MPDAPWRCSECGTVNEPVANSCRTCGKWPSLFDLQDSLVEDVERVDTREPAPSAPFPTDTTVLEPEVFEPETFEQEPFEAEPLEPEPYELEDEAEDEDGTERSRGRRLASFIVPIAFAIYLVISIVFGDR
ncbi:MAG: hypothetical protein ACRDPZ_08575 [Gaiellaceae bacterium]